MTQQRQAEPRPEQEEKRNAGVSPTAGPAPRQFGKDFLTGCLALIIIGLVAFVVVPILVVVLKLSLLIAIPIGLVVLLVIFTTLFGRIINALRKQW
jgi:hypothetical protein